MDERDGQDESEERGDFFSPYYYPSASCFLADKLASSPGHYCPGRSVPRIQRSYCWRHSRTRPSRAGLINAALSALQTVSRACPLTVPTARVIKGTPYLIIAETRPFC
jgi:hypothetical protein